MGDIFGAPLAIEGLLAFFLESTFLGLWIFGWGRLSPRVHLATIWVAAVGTVLSAYFILAANSWMQHPVGYAYNPVTGRAELTDFLAMLTNSTALITFAHTIPAAFMTTGAFVAGISMYRMLKDRDRPEVAAPFRSTAKAGAIMLLVSGLLVAITGRHPGQDHDRAAADEDGGRRGALGDRAARVLLDLHDRHARTGREDIFSIRIPYLLSFLATGTFDGKVEGINDLQAMEEARFGPGDYTPNTPITYWTFRWMIGIGGLAALAAAWFLFPMRKGRTPAGRTVLVAVLLPFLPLAANSFAWMFTEIGRQPWIVYGLMATAAAVSPTNDALMVLITMVGFTLLYGALAVVMVGLVVRRVRHGLPEATADTGFEHEAEPALGLGY